MLHEHRDTEAQYHKSTGAQGLRSKEQSAQKHKKHRNTEIGAQGHRGTETQETPELSHCITMASERRITRVVKHKSTQDYLLETRQTLLEMRKY